MLYDERFSISTILLICMKMLYDEHFRDIYNFLLILGNFRKSRRTRFFTYSNDIPYYMHTVARSSKKNFRKNLNYYDHRIVSYAYVTGTGSIFQVKMLYIEGFRK